VSRRLPLVLLMVLAPALAAGQRLDWDPEEPEPRGLVGRLRDVRDGLLGLLDDTSDAQLAAFAEGTLLLSTVTMAASDVVGLIDDNGITEHVFKGAVSKSPARIAWLLHVAGSETILGSHGLETESWIRGALVDLNPLLDPEEEGPALPLDPLDFVGEGLVHTRVYTARLPGALLAAALAADLVVRPAGNLARILGLRGTADGLERTGRRLVRGALP